MACPVSMDSCASTYKALHKDMLHTWMQFACLHVQNEGAFSTETAADPSAKIMAYHYCLLNRMAPNSRLASSPCFGVVVMGCMLWCDPIGSLKGKLVL